MVKCEGTHEKLPGLRILLAVLGILDILVRIRNCGSATLTNGSGSGFGSGSDSRSDSYLQ
jgi:hypothetical protein